MKFGLHAKALPMIYQSQDGECALACLAMISGFHGHKIDLLNLRRRAGDQANGCSLARLSDMAASLKLAPRALSLELEELCRLTLPAILHWDFNHFVVLQSVNARYFTVHDPALGIRQLSAKAMDKHFTGVALELRPLKDFKRQDDRNHLRLSDLIPLDSNTRQSLGKLLTLSLLTQILILCSPLYLQLVVDEVLIKQDSDLLLTLAGGFLFLFLLSALGQTLMAISVIYLSSQLSCTAAISVFYHLIQLPTRYFIQRQTGDILSRFHSTQPLQAFVSHSLTQMLVSCVILIGSLAILIYYSRVLTGVILCFLLAYLILRLAAFQPLKHASHEVIVQQARLESRLMETLSVIPTLKHNQALETRAKDWSNDYIESTNANIRLENKKLGFDLAGKMIQGLGHILIIYLAASQVIAGSMSLGMLYALLAYRNHLNGSAITVIDEYFQLKMLGLHLDRLADICLTEKEEAVALSTVAITQASNQDIQHIELKEVDFYWEEQKTPLFTKVNLRLAKGKFLAIEGNSGSGKSTLLRIMLGQLKPTAGDIRVNHYAMTGPGNAIIKEKVAAVMADDRVISGTIASNITLDKDQTDYAQLLEAASITGLDTVVQGLPLGYDTPVGALGSTLSMGQIQRLILTRALYQQPSWLFLDEGTAHLDQQSEAAIMQRLRGAGITVVFTTHRTSLLSLADEVIQLEKCQIHQRFNCHQPGEASIL
ncbi:MAG: peptidase domain-containing ABC transporter [Gammaproteobacteria bacterium]|nr:peptidase domain-containing ABC transporter [Gammaproteobacteria bacterium]